MSDITNQQLLQAVTESISTIADNMVTTRDVRDIVRAETTDIREEQLRQSVLLEDLDNSFKTVAGRRLACPE
jgi:single-stranded DNA-specific DHH superfamily exonuclease